MKIKTKISTVRSRALLLTEVKKKIKKTPQLVCPALNRRKVFLSKWLNSNVGSGRGSTKRLQSFFAGVEIIKKSQTAIQNPKNKHEWSLSGETPCGAIVKVHIREEKDDGNRLLFYISNFHKKKTTLPSGL